MSFVCFFLEIRWLCDQELRKTQDLQQLRDTLRQDLQQLLDNQTKKIEQLVQATGHVDNGPGTAYFFA